MMITTNHPTPARWNNTGGDMQVHLVPEGTQVMVNPTQDEVWAFSFQVTTPLCGRGTYHGGWTQVDLPPQLPLKLCTSCFPDDQGPF